MICYKSLDSFPYVQTKWTNKKKFIEGNTCTQVSSLNEEAALLCTAETNECSCCSQLFKRIWPGFEPILELTKQYLLLVKLFACLVQNGNISFKYKQGLDQTSNIDF